MWPLFLMSYKKTAFSQEYKRRQTGPTNKAELVLYKAGRGIPRRFRFREKNNRIESSGEEEYIYFHSVVIKLQLFSTDLMSLGKDAIISSILHRFLGHNLINFSAQFILFLRKHMFICWKSFAMIPQSCALCVRGHGVIKRSCFVWLKFWVSSQQSQVNKCAFHSEECGLWKWNCGGLKASCKSSHRCSGLWLAFSVA